jgi:hypothetical protein
MNSETPDTPAPPPLAAWWGRTGLLYVGLSVLGAVAGRTLAHLVWATQPPQTSQGTVSIPTMVLAHVQGTSFFGAAFGAAQWIALRRLVRRGLLAASGRALSQPERRLVRDTALWIVATVAGMTSAGVVEGAIYGLLFQAHAYALLGLPSAVLDGLIGGCSTGTAQWLVLRHRVPGAGTWIRSTVFGFLLGSIAGFVGCTVLQAVFQPVLSPASPAAIWFFLTGTVWTALIAGVTALFQARRLKRLAPGWMKRVHDAAREGAREEGTVGRDPATGSEARTGS